MEAKRHILFLSALDFKEKSIQVIRKTPEAYFDKGWQVSYVVCRDTSVYGNYFYENEVNIDGITIHRFVMPFVKIRDKLKNNLLRTFFAKFASYVAIYKMARIANSLLKQHDIDVIYGYEIQAVLAVNLLRLFGKLGKIKVISRFQGTFYGFYIKNQKLLKMLLNFEHYLALYLPSDLCIMTNDGTQGDAALAAIKSKNLANYRFWVNGVNKQLLPETEITRLKEKLLDFPTQKMFLTVCRLAHWKRVDRTIQVIAILKNHFQFSDFKYYIIGEGQEKNRLQRLCQDLGVAEQVVFVGAIDNQYIKEYLNAANIFFSTYDSSNVGNPLLEALSAHKIIFTLNNGDTHQWIQHRENGFIYDINENLYRNMAEDLFNLIKDQSLQDKLIAEIRKTAKDKLWSWNDRMEAEIMEVEKLLLGRVLL